MPPTKEATVSDALRAASRPDDLVAAVLADHAEIKELFSQVDRASGSDARRDAFERLVRKLAVHETAEEEVVHPLLGQAPGGDAVAEARVEEESRSKDLLSELEKRGVDDPEFDTRFAQLRTEVLAHAEQEEREEHPKLEQVVGPDRLQQLAGIYRAAESMAPTHPHPKGPDSAVGNMVVGPFAAVADRARDAVRNAMRS
jgi:hemerythrin superfamily protein